MRIKQTINPSRFGFYCHTTHGVMTVEPSQFSFTRRGIERKAAKRARRLRAEQAAWAQSEVLTDGKVKG